MLADTVKASLRRQTVARKKSVAEQTGRVRESRVVRWNQAIVVLDRDCVEHWTHRKSEPRSDGCSR